MPKLPSLIFLFFPFFLIPRRVRCDAEADCSTHLQTTLAPKRADAYPLVIAVFSGEVSKGYRSTKGSYPERRDAIRQTWGSLARHSNVPYFFVFSSYLLSEENKVESVRHKDILILDDPDGKAWGYERLTAKTLELIRYMSKQCARIKYLAKCDDDSYAHVPRLLAFAEATHGHFTVAGMLHMDLPVFRGGQWDSTDFETATGLHQYPRYSQGGGYMLSGDLVHALGTISALVPMQLWRIEDVSLAVWMLGWNVTVVDMRENYGFVEVSGNITERLLILCHDKWYFVHRILCSEVANMYTSACERDHVTWRKRLHTVEGAVRHIPETALDGRRKYLI